MEDPTGFDVWLLATEVNSRDVVMWIEDLSGRELSLKDKLAISRVITTSNFFEAFSRVAWVLVCEVRTFSPTWVSGLEVYQEGFLPSEKSRIHYCLKHDYYHGGCLGCHVCHGYNK